MELKQSKGVSLLISTARVDFRQQHFCCLQALSPPYAPYERPIGQVMTIQEESQSHPARRQAGALGATL